MSLSEALNADGDGDNVAPARRQTVVDAVIAHRRAIELDEACYDADAKLIHGAERDSRIRDGILAGLLRQIVEVPCRHPSDVELKVDYLLNGTVGIRDSIICDVLNLGDSEEVLTALLRSLVLSPAPTIATLMSGRIKADATAA